MKARFIEGANELLAIEFLPETDDERLLLKMFDLQMRPDMLLRVQGWKLGPVKDEFVMQAMRAHIVKDPK